MRCDLSLSKKYPSKRDMGYEKKKEGTCSKHVDEKRKKRKESIAHVQNKGGKRERWSCKKEFHNLDGNN
jgi:hypothetical protein